MNRPSRNVIAGGAALLAAGLLIGWVAAHLLSPQRGVPTIALYDDWRVACPAAAEHKACELSHDVIDAASRQRVARLTLTRDDGKTTLTVTAPLNVLIQPGLGLALGRDKPRRYPFVTCLNAGCIAQIPVDDALLAALREEPQARLQFANPERQMMQIAFPLSGFARADDAARRGHGLVW